MINHTSGLVNAWDIRQYSSILHKEHHQVRTVSQEKHVRANHLQSHLSPYGMMSAQEVYYPNGCQRKDRNIASKIMSAAKTVKKTLISMVSRVAITKDGRFWKTSSNSLALEAK